MGEPKRLTVEELESIERVMRYEHMDHLFVKVLDHIAALEAELARIGAIAMGLIPEPEPTEGVEAKVWEMVKVHRAELAKRDDEITNQLKKINDLLNFAGFAKDQIAQRDEEIARLRDELDAACEVGTSRKLKIRERYT